MNRNTELHFGNTPKIDLKRSKFDMSSSHKTTFNTGDIIPIFCDPDILPGDTAQVDLASLVRMATPIYPVMDNLYLDTYWFFVPHRLVWNHWAEFWGQNDDPWARQTEYEIPQITPPTGGWTEGTIADYMGIPTKVKCDSVNALPFRAYVKIWNDWFRDENLKSASHMYTDDSTRTGSNGGDYVLDAELGGKPLKAAKLHDLFTSSLPSPQRGPAISIPLGTSVETTLSGTATGTVTGGSITKTARILELGAAKTWTPTMTSLGSQGSVRNVYMYQEGGAGTNSKLMTDGATTTTSSTSRSTISFSNAGVTDGALNIALPDRTATVPLNGVRATVDLSNATAATVAQLRLAFAIQKYYENAGLHGTRYIEYIRSVFGVTSSDARMQRAEYLGGKRVPINMDQVLQTSSTDNTSPQGNTSGFSCTFDKHSAFTKSFEEHGTLMCVAVIRAEHTYQQGLHKKWTRKKWTDYYNPFFANISEQPVLVKELYAQTAGMAANDEAFGYQEAWAEYRYHQNMCSGYMRSNAQGSLDVWHYADNYSQQPILGSAWIDEPYENVDRTIAVTSQLSHQFIADFYFKTYYTRPMPVYSVPGLIDHV